MNEKDSIIDAAARFAQQQMQQPAQPQTVQPQPVPMSIQLSGVTDNHGDKFVVLMIATPQGQSVFFFTPEQVESLSRALIDTAQIARTGLEIPRI